MCGYSLEELKLQLKIRLPKDEIVTHVPQSNLAAFFSQYLPAQVSQLWSTAETDVKKFFLHPADPTVANPLEWQTHRAVYPILSKV